NARRHGTDYSTHGGRHAVVGASGRSLDQGVGMSRDDDGSEEVPWFRRFRSDGRIEPHAAGGADGEIMIIDRHGWAAAFKDGTWSDGILFQHEQIAEFSPVQKRDDIYRLLDQARAALGASGKPDD